MATSNTGIKSNLSIYLFVEPVVKTIVKPTRKKIARHCLTLVSATDSLTIQIFYNALFARLVV